MNRIRSRLDRLELTLAPYGEEDQGWADWLEFREWAYGALEEAGHFEALAAVRPRVEINERAIDSRRGRQWLLIETLWYNVRPFPEALALLEARVRFFEIARAIERLPDPERGAWLDRIEEWRRRAAQGGGRPTP